MKKSQADYAKESREFVTMQRHAALSTISLSRQGYPFGSFVPYDMTADGKPVIYVSLIAEHYKNLSADAKASLLVFDPFGLENPQAYARASVLVNFKIADAVRVEEVKASYEKRFPGSINYEIAHNFVFMLGEPYKIRWIGGFGDMTWVDGKAFCEAELDSIIYHSMDIIDHMNSDHRDALIDYVRAFSDYKPDKAEVQMTKIDATTFSLAVKTPKGRKDLTLKLPQRIETPEEARSTLIKLLKQAREKLSN